ncbi:hypothetical protein F5884DRAFT_863625 [Xylogone sp. PMI_703]|nr:hypothetical protein F5884DRAFT_863625 [Xylogone sp. PMI_703]
MVQFLPSVTLACAAFSVCGHALDFYVSPSSRPFSEASADGLSPQRPFSSFEVAQAAVRKAITNMRESITIHVADGLYILDAPLNFTSADSGRNGHTVDWKATGSNAIISGGIRVSGWKLANATTNIYSANVPKGLRSRNLYVNGWAANYARRLIQRKDFQYTNTSMVWTSPQYDWLMTTPGISNAEIRAINSFTDRYAPIEAVGNRELIMKQDSWANNIIGYDTIPQPNADFGVWVQNALELLHEGGQHFLDSEAGVVYYIPLAGENMSTAETYIGRLEALIVVGGTYDQPAHDISFTGLHFQHTTWLKPSDGYGYVDQQTGGYIGENVTYPQFEASRPRWFQMPSAIQVSAAERISFTGGSYTQLGAGGFGIGNDDNAHLTGIGLGANGVSVSDGYFTQVMGNSITAGGITADAHHPSDPRMVNTNILITGNIFYNVSSLYSSTVSVFVSYIQHSEISHNDIFMVPYSGICHGYGWGSNDAGGSQTYINRGLYNFQPLYETPTTSMNNLIHGNLIHAYGLSHTDLGATYTLSKSPETHLSNNYALNSSWFGMYTDEGSNSYIVTNNDYLSNGNWYAPNQGCLTCGVHNGNNTLKDNFGHVAPDEVNFPNGSGNFNDTFIDNLNVASLDLTNEVAHRVAYRAGILPGKRGSRPVSNPETPDSYLSLSFLPGPSEQVLVTAKLSNFDDVDFTSVSFNPLIIGASNYTIVPQSPVPRSIPANSAASATWKLVAAPYRETCLSAPTVSVTVKYKNPRTGLSETISGSGTLPGLQPLPPGLSASATWPEATSGELCSSGSGTLFAIRVGGRDVYSPYDDWATIYKSSSLAVNGSVTSQVLSLDAADPWTKAGVVIRNSLASNGSFNGNVATGYAGVFVTANNGVSFQWDANGDGRLETLSTVAGLTAPLWVRLTVLGTQFTGYFSTDGKQWTQIGSAVTLATRNPVSDAGVLVSSHAGYTNATGVFSGLQFS